MKYTKLKLIKYIIPVIVFIYPAYSSPETTTINKFLDSLSGQIEILSKTFEVYNKKSLVTFSGDVEAISEDFNIKCQKIELFYENLDEGNNPGEDQFQILEIIATEDIILSRTDGSTATGEKAVYNQNDEIVVLTGDPAVVRQGDDYNTEGAKITYYLEEDRYIVEGPEDGRTKTIYFPKEENR